MADKFSMTSQFELSRRDLVKNMAVLAGTATLGTMITEGTAAAADAKVTGYGVTTAQLKDWSIMTKSMPARAKISIVMGAPMKPMMPVTASPRAKRSRRLSVTRAPLAVTALSCWRL